MDPESPNSKRKAAVGGNWFLLRENATRRGPTSMESSVCSFL